MQDSFIYSFVWSTSASVNMKRINSIRNTWHSLFLHEQEDMAHWVTISLVSMHWQTTFTPTGWIVNVCEQHIFHTVMENYKVQKCNLTLKGRHRKHSGHARIVDCLLKSSSVLVSGSRGGNRFHNNSIIFCPDTDSVGGVQIYWFVD